MRHRILMGIRPLVCLLLAGCASHMVTVVQAPGLELPGRYKFRMNYTVHDPDGKAITDEIMETDLNRWLLFTEMTGAARASFEDRGYVWVYDPLEPADFIVDVGFTAFYSEKMTHEEMQNQKPASLMVGAVKGGTYSHMVVISVLTRPPGLAAEGFVTFWEGRGIVDSSDADVRMAGFPLIADIVNRFPPAQPR